jgi:type I site-specific restriction endonuclease
MVAEIVSQGATEADLEVRIDAALTKAFWWLPSDSLRHQTKLRFKLGHAHIEVDGVAKEKAEGRADVLLFHNDKTLAIFELKRPGMSLTEADREQALCRSPLLENRTSSTHASRTWYLEETGFRTHGYWNCEILQYCKGLWVHNPGGRRKGHLRS